MMFSKLVLTGDLLLVGGDAAAPALEVQYNCQLYTEYICACMLILGVAAE
jgi:hypothetical protein